MSIRKIHTEKNNRNLSSVIKSVGPWLVWLSGLCAGPRTKGSLVGFPVRVHAWVAVLVPNKGHMRINCTLISLSLCLSHSLSLLLPL